MSDDNQAAEEAHAEEESSTVGSMLKAAREELELSVEQISGELRIEARFLTALEADDFDEFSAPVFTKGYIKQYGERLGLDYADLLAQYYRQADAQDVTLKHNQPIRLRDEQQVTQWVIAASILVLLIGGFAAWYLTEEETAPVVTPTAADSFEAIEPEEAGSIGDLPPEPAPLPETPDVPVVEVEEPAPVPAPVVTEEVPTPAEDETAASAVPELVAGPTVQVTISFEEDCWTEVSDATGERFFYGLGSAGAVSSFDAQLPLSFFLGNAAGVAIELNGVPYPIPANSRQGNLARFVIAEGP